MRTPSTIRFIRSVGLLAVLSFTTTVKAQLVVSPQTNLQQLAAAISGSGVQISNPVIVCHSQGYGEFSYTGNILGINDGILLTSGTIDNAVGPNNVENKTFQASTSGNSILNTVTGRTTYDACRFEFDIIPSGDSLKFNFVFASEEYNEWVGSQYNDVFGFFISGPGITGDPGIGSDHNIARVPGTNQAVTINNVNNGSNSAYYFDNAGGPFVQYDGMTRGLKAVSQVQPCQTYHLKLIVADASDKKFDSGVFIERIASNQVTMASYTQNGTPNMVEGCNPGWVRFTRSAVPPTPLVLQYFLEGTATNGVDYTTIGDPSPLVAKTVTIPANQAYADVPVNPTIDGLAEGTEHLRFILGNPLCPGAALDTLIFNIQDTLTSSVSPAGMSTICRGSSVQFQVTGGATYTWSPAAGLNATNIPNPIASPTVTTNYTVTINEGDCSRAVHRLVRVSDPVITGNVAQPLCNGQSNGAINATVTGGIPPYAYAWVGPNGFTASTEDLVNVPAGTYTLTVTDAFGCVRTQSFNVGSPSALSVGVTPSILAFGQNIACSGGSTGTLSSAISGGSGPYTTSWSGPNGFSSSSTNISGLGAGAYTVSITDANGCTATNGFTMAQSQALVLSTSNVQPVLCHGNNTGSAQANVSGGMPPYSFSWNSSPVQTAATATNLPAGNRTVTVTDFYGCTSATTVLVPGPTQPLSSSLGATANVGCFGASTGNATVIAAGGTTPYTYGWNSSPVQTTATATGLPAGTYACTITDANGCSTTRNATITQPASVLSSSIAAQTNVTCFGNATGGATANASGGSAPYTYSWNSSPVQNVANATNLIAGNYTCTITDAAGCSTSNAVTITQPAVGLSSSIASQTNVNCFGGNSGSATVAVSGGTAPYNYSWNSSPVQNGAAAINLSAGNYTCTITDASGCSTTRGATITQPAAALNAMIGAQANVSCFGGSSGSATINVSGGTAPYSYGWNTSPVQTGATATGLSAGGYLCTVTDANGCITTRSVAIAQPAAALAGNVSAQTNVGCFGGSTGSATVAATGGTGPYNYAWNSSPVQNGAIASNLPAGSYTCTITDANGCSASRAVTIAQPAAALGSNVSAQTNVNCFSGNGGSVTVVATGGTAPYSYSWNTSPVQGTATATGLIAGTHTCTITDANGCSTTRSATITQPAGSLGSNIVSQTNVSCFGGPSGSAAVAGSGGTAPYTYSWNTAPAQTTASTTGLVAGAYTCTITDANGCTATRNVTISQPPMALAGTISPSTNVACFGGSTGSAAITASGGTAPYTYSWNTIPVQTSATAINLSAGTYTCTIADGNGCTVTRNATIVQPIAALGSSISGQTDVLCFGASAGSATVTGSGGTAPYTYSWNSSPAQSGPTASNLPAGGHTCTITDANGCTTTRNVTITQPVSAVSVALSSQTNVSCFGGFTGSATVSAAGGAGPYAYAWNTVPVQNGANASALAAGNYTCTVTDANGCTATRNVTISQPASGLALNGSITAATCGGSADGEVDATVSGGTSPYTFAWSGPNGFTASSEDISAVVSGAYTLNVTDAVGCTASQTFNVGQPGLFTISGIVSDHNGSGASCANASDGSIDQTVSGGTAPFTHAWTGPNSYSASSVDITGLSAGTYTYIITDDNGCSTSASYVVTAPAPLSASLTAATVPGGWNIACNSASTGSVTTAISGGTAPYATAWAGPNGFTSTASDISLLSVGTYTIAITDANGCSFNASSTLAQAPLLSGTATINAHASCFGAADGVAVMAATGGTAPYDYAWNTVPVQTTAVANGLSAGPWTCTITDANGCSAQADATINGPAAALSASITGSSDVLCFDAAQGTADALAAGGTAPYTYGWNTAPAQSGPNAVGLAQGDHLVTVTDANGCQASTTVTINGPLAPLSAYFEQVSHVTCFGLSDGSATLDVSGGSGSYIIVWDTQPPTFGPTATGLAPGPYMVIVSDSNGCVESKSVPLMIVGPASPFSLTLVPTAISCTGSNDGTVDLTFFGGAGPYTYQWFDTQGGQTGNEDLVNLGADTYTLHAFDALGCAIDTAITFTEPVPVAITGTVVPAECSGASNGAIDATVTGGTSAFTFAWTGPNGFAAIAEDLAGLDAGAYLLTVTDGNGCSASSSFDVSQPGSLQATVLASNHTGGWGTSCTGSTDGSIDLDVTGGSAPYAFAWSGTGGFASTDEDISGLQAGTYTVSITDQNGCALNTGATLTAPDELGTTLSPSVFGGMNISCAGATDGAIDLIIAGGTAPFTHDWTGSNGFTASTEDLLGLSGGTYNVTVVDANGCSQSASAMLMEPQPIASSVATSIFAGGSQVSCQGAVDGTIDLTVSGGSAPYQFAWSDGSGFAASTEDVTGIGAGTYQVSITDANGCTADQVATLNAPTALDFSATLSSINGNNVTCQGVDDGSIDLTVSGGTAPYAFSWNDGSTDEDRTGIGAGTYTVIITDANGCSANASYTLTAPTSVTSDLTLSGGPTGPHITCFGAADGSIDALVSGGTTPYVLDWTGPNGFTSSSPNLSGLIAGAYGLTVTDANGCTVDLSTTLIEPSSVGVALSSTTFNGNYNIPCAGLSIGDATATADGGTPGYTYAWTGPNGFSSASANITGLSGGPYDVLATDLNGCTASASITIQEPAVLDAVIGIIDLGGGYAVSCAGNDGSATVSVTGGTPAIQYSWTGPDGFGSTQADITGLQAGTYDLTISDANGCTMTQSITLEAPAPITATFAQTSSTCHGAAEGSIDLSVTGGAEPYDIAWTGPGGFTSTDEDLISLNGGTYSVTVTDILGCSSTFLADLAEPAPINSGTYVSFYGLYNLQCMGDSTGVIEFAPTGGNAPFTVQVTGPGGYSSNSLSNTLLVAGEYLVSITDLNGCSMDTTVTLSEPSTNPVASLSLSVYPSGTNISCHGASDGWIDATVIGGNGPFTFSWRGPDSLEFNTEDVFGLPAGTYGYELVVTDANQCSFFTQVLLTEPDSAIAATTTLSEFNGGNNVSCPGSTDGSIDLAVSGGNGGYTYDWTGPNGFTSALPDVAGIGAGSYAITITDINGCVLVQPVDLVSPDEISILLDALTYASGSNISCNGSSDGSIAAVVAGGSPGYASTWTGPNGFSATGDAIHGLPEGTYCLNILDANDCPAQSCTTIVQPAALEASVVTGDAPCGQASGTIDLEVNGGSAPYGYAWNNGTDQQDLSGLIAGEYMVMITDVNGCSTTTTAIVVGAAGVTAIGTVANNLCNGGTQGSINLEVTSGTAPYSYAWNNGSTLEDLQDLTAGVYSVTITDANGCAWNEVLTVGENAAIAIDPVLSMYPNGHHVSVFHGSDGSASLEVTGGTAPYTYLWSNGSQEDHLYNAVAGSYSVTVTDANGCTMSRTIELTEPSDLVLPTGYTPNGDGHNDAFIIQGLESYPHNTLVVLNRWGNVVYDRLNYSNDWVGENGHGQQLPDGTYFVILNVNDGQRTLQTYVDLRR